MGKAVQSFDRILGGEKGKVCSSEKASKGSAKKHRGSSFESGGAIWQIFPGKVEWKTAGLENWKRGGKFYLKSRRRGMFG